MFEIAGLISGVTAGVDALKAAVRARDEAKIDAAISDLKDRLFNLQTANLEVVEQLHAAQTKVHALVQELNDIKAKVSERGMYILHNLAQDGKAFWAYRYEPSRASVDAPAVDIHYLCQPCWDAGKKSVLVRGRTGYTCNVCGKFVFIADCMETGPRYF